MPDDTPFFIVGAGRSGTTLLRLMLSGHSRIHIPPETWYVEDLVRELPLKGSLSPAQRDRAIDIMTNHYRWPDLQIPAEEFRRSATALELPSLRDLLDLVYNHHLRIHGKQHFGDKTPRYFRIAPQLGTLYPGSKFIHLIRDGRDVAISEIDADWGRYYDRSGFNWTAAMKWRYGYRRSPCAARILEVRYEDLVSRPEAELRRICEFLGEEFEPGMLDWDSNVSGLLPQREQPIHAKLTGPLRSDNVGVWQKRLSPLECFAVESCLQRDLRRLGYPLRFANLAWRPALIVAGRLLNAAAPLLKRTVPYLQRRNYLPRTIFL